MDQSPPFAPPKALVVDHHDDATEAVLPLQVDRLDQNIWNRMRVANDRFNYPAMFDARRPTDLCDRFPVPAEDANRHRIFRLVVHALKPIGTCHSSSLLDSQTIWQGGGSSGPRTSGASGRALTAGTKSRSARLQAPAAELLVETGHRRPGAEREQNSQTPIEGLAKRAKR